MLVNVTLVPQVLHNNLNDKCMSQINADLSSRDTILDYNINIQCLLANQTELEYHLEQHRLHIVTLQETWLDASTEDLDIKSYVAVSRCDRRSTDRTCGYKCGGILISRRADFNCLVRIQDSDSEERSWHCLDAQLETS